MRYLLVFRRVERETSTKDEIGLLSSRQHIACIILGILLLKPFVLVPLSSLRHQSLDSAFVSVSGPTFGLAK